MIVKKLKSYIAKEEFFPGALSFFTTPYFIARHSLLSNVRSIAPSLNGDILDFGCGSKPYRDLFVNSRSYVGVDVEISGHDHSTSNVDYFYNGKTLPFADNKYDNIVSFEVFEHVINLNEIVPELFRILKPNGLIIITVPFVFPEHENPYDFRRFTVNGLKSFLNDNGFDLISGNKYPSAILTIAQSFIHYIFQNLSPKNTAARAILHFLVSLPIMCISYALSAIFPKGDDFYMASMVIARRRTVI